MKSTKIAVILAGCGHLDGAEIRESVLSLLALENEQASYELFALDANQHHVINHVTGEEVTNQHRNMLVESARIARGKVNDVAQLAVADFDALLIPGGFGVAKNLSDFAFKGHGAAVVTEISAVIRAFHAAGKPIGAVCIAPAVVALSLGDKNPTLTIGNDEATASELEKLGATHQNCATTDCVVDKSNKIVSSPAYMDDNAKLADVYAGVTKLAAALVEMV